MASIYVPYRPWGATFTPPTHPPTHPPTQTHFYILAPTPLHVLLYTELLYSGTQQLMHPAHPAPPLPFTVFWPIYLQGAHPGPGVVLGAGRGPGQLALVALDPACHCLTRIHRFTPRLAHTCLAATPSCRHPSDTSSPRSRSGTRLARPRSWYGNFDIILDQTLIPALYHTACRTWFAICSTQCHADRC